ncbi:MAG: hypothetical protein V1702_01575 [Candidatus Woesearchaeota archaeon]
MVFKPRYKQLCAICRKQHALIMSRNQFPICTSCSMKQINQPIHDEKFRKLFDIDQKLYEESSFLRSIKSNYVRFKSLSEKQIVAFKKVAAELAKPEKAARKRKKPLNS